MFNNQIIAGSSGQGGGFYSKTIDQSLRCNGSNEYLTRTPSSSGNRRTWTFSAWVKLGVDGVRFPLIEAYSDGTNFTMAVIHTDGRIQFYTITSATDYGGITTQYLRDPSAWYHIVFRFDSTQSTAADRIRLYVNGVQQETNPWTDYGQMPQNYDSFINHTVANNILKNTNSSQYGQGYIAEVHHVDGTSYGPDTFAETKDGVWVPKAVSGVSYGTNGFYLNFANSSDIGNNANSTDGTNDWTVNNFTATDIVSDSPTNSFCTLNPLTHGTYPTLKEGNLSIATVYSADLCGVTSTWFPTTGKWYWEIHAEGSTLTYPYFGITDQRQILTNSTKGSFYSVAWLRTGSSAAMTGTNTYMGTITKENATSWTNNDIIMFALDVDARKLWIGKNGTWNDSGDPAAGTGENASWTVDTGVSPSFMGYSGQGVNSVFNFGQDGTFNGNQTAQGNADGNGVGNFYYSPPSGFLAMATSNIEEPAIGPNSTTNTDENFDIVLFNGTGANQTVTGFNFQPDFVWNKTRNQDRHHTLNDSLRGAGHLKSSNTDGEGAGTISAYNSDGYDWTYNSSNVWYNNSATVVSWAWKAGGTAVSNSDGSLTCNVSANTDTGFSIVTWTANSDNGTLGHGLNSAPEMIIAKPLGGGTNWYVMHTTAINANQVLNLDSTTGAFNPGVNHFNDTYPTSTVFSYGGYLGDDLSNDDKVAYCFHSVEGFSKVGKYRGNANANGAFVYTGFRPAWVMVKRSDSTGWWGISDSARSTYNEIANTLAANQAYSESTLTSDLNLDFLSNGFKIRDTDGYYNASGGTYIYLAFAEAPFKYANAR